MVYMATVNVTNPDDVSALVIVYYSNYLYLLVFQVQINIRCSSPELLVASGKK